MFKYVKDKLVNITYNEWFKAIYKGNTKMIDLLKAVHEFSLDTKLNKQICLNYEKKKQIN